MHKLISPLFCFLLLISFPSSAQVIDGFPVDSSMIRFTSDTIPNFIPDTSSNPLWQIGHSRKSFFGIDSIDATSIMTDTIHSYRVNANNWFVITGITMDAIVDFWHKCQTTREHDGGIVEFSQDSGMTW